MRTKILKYFGMVVVLIIMVNLTSCEVSIESWYDDDDYSEIHYTSSSADFTRKIRKIRQNPHLTRSIAGNFGDTKETAEDHPVNGK